MKRGKLSGCLRPIMGVAVVGALTLGVSALAAPRGGDDSASRGTTKGATEVTRLVTGDPAQINSVIAGGPGATAILAITPVGAKAGAYPAGTVIVGNELTSPNDNFRAFFDVQVSNWDPNADNSPQLKVYQVKIDSAGYMDATPAGDQPDLTPPNLACPGADPTPCTVAFGEGWAECRPDDTCGPGYIDLVGIGRPDSWCSPSGGSCAAGACDTATSNYRWFSVSNAATGRQDHDFTCVGGARNGQSCNTSAQCSGSPCTGPKHQTFYGGSLVLDVPVGAKGTYTVGLITDETYMEDTNAPPLRIPLAAANGFEVTITTGSCCSGLGGPGATCEDDLLASECATRPTPRVFTPGALCSDGCVECTVEGNDPLCNDGDACTTESCNATLGICVRGNKAGYPAAGACCDPGTGTITSNDDGNACTDDSCSGNPVSGSPTPGNGTPTHTPSSTATLCDDQNPCTSSDHCAGPPSTSCTGTDINSLPCTVDADCPNNDCTEATGFCFCTATPDLDYVVTNSAKAPMCEGGSRDGLACGDPPVCPGGTCNEFANGGNCFGEDEKVMVAVRVGASGAPINGGQFLMTYDPSCLDFNSVTCLAPYTETVYGPIVNENAGTIFVACGVDPFCIGPACDGPPGNVNMISLSFQKRGVCNECELCFDNNNPQNTYLTDDDGQKVGVNAACKAVRDRGEMELNVPDDIKTNADCDSPTAVETWDSPTASHTCSDVVLTCRGAHESGLAYSQSVVMNGGQFPKGSSSFCCSAAADDPCGATAGCTPPGCGAASDGCWTVEVNDETSLDVDVQLCPPIAHNDANGELTRCIKFCLYSSCAEEPICFTEDVTFGGLFNFSGKFSGKMKVDGDRKWGCITAQDQLHTLRSCYTFDPDSDCVDGQLHAAFKGDQHFGGNCLLGGNLDGWKKPGSAHPGAPPGADPSLDVIDILDFGTFVSQFNVCYPDNDTPCGTPGPNADINGDGCVTGSDYTFITNNFLGDTKDCCCGPQAADVPPALTEVSVDELRQMGLDDLIVADLNGDGVLNTDDMDAFMQGVRPAKSHDRKGGKGLRSGR